MSLISIGAKVGIGIGKHLPAVTKAVAANAHNVTVVKFAVVSGHIALTTVKIASAGIAGIIATHWIGL